MKHLLTTLLLLCSLTVNAQDVIVTGPKKPNPENPKIYTVKTAAEFLNALGSNRTIRVTGYINITPTLLSYIANKKIKRTNFDNPYYSTAGIYARDTYVDEEELTLYNIHNLTIEGTNLAISHIQTEHYGAFVLAFANCSNIKLKNLTLGHVEKGHCMGGVIDMNSCRNFTIENCDLYGCGTYGICAEQTNVCTFKNSTIRDCSYGIMQIYGCSNFKFTNSKFIRNSEYELLTIKKCTDIDFTSCTISQNKGNLYDFDCNVVFNGCIISHDSSEMGTTNYAIIR